MRLARMHTSGKGVQTADTMRKPLLLKKIQCAISYRWLIAKALGGKPSEHIISPQRPMLLQQNLQHPTAHRGQPQPLFSYQSLSPTQSIRTAMRMIMRRKGKIRRFAAGASVRMDMRHAAPLTCYIITIIPPLVAKQKALTMRYIISLALATLPTAALAEVPNVVTDIPPVHALVAQVMGDLGTPTLLLEKGADEHDFQLRPSQMQSIADADTVIWIGPELTPWLDRAMTDSKAVSLALLDAKGTQTQAYLASQGEEEEAHDEADHAEHADHADEADHAGHADEAEHAHDGSDPHAWMNPTNAAIWVDLIAADLSTLDPENAATYAANAANAKTRIATMDAEITAQLSAIKDKKFVTFHAAYGYFTAHYGLGNAAALALGDATTPGAAKLTELQAELKSGAYTCAFPEVQHDPAMLTQLMQGTATKLGQPLDPVGSSLPFGPDAYDTLMRSIANTLSDCLNG